MGGEQFGAVDRQRRDGDGTDQRRDHRGDPQRPTPGQIGDHGEGDPAGDADGADQPTAAAIRESSPEHDADASGGVGGEHEHGDPDPGEATFGAKELVEELCCGGEEQRPQEAR